MDIDGQLSLWNMMSQGEEEVKINGALNVHSKPKVTPFEVTLTTGDLTLIVAMIEDYIKGLDVIKANDIQWDAYYRKKFKGMSEKIQQQINYDYEKALVKCQKKSVKEDDIGEEAMALTIKRSMAQAKKEEAKKEEEAKDEKL